MEETSKLLPYWDYSPDLLSEFVNDVVRQGNNQQDMLNDIVPRMLEITDTNSRVGRWWSFRV